MKFEEVSALLKIKDSVTHYRMSDGRFRRAIVDSSENTLQQTFLVGCRVQATVTSPLQWPARALHRMLQWYKYTVAVQTWSTTRDVPP